MTGQLARFATPNLEGSVADSKYDDIISAGVLAAGGAGVPGSFVPGLDMPVVMGVWGTMLYKIAEKAGHPKDMKFWTKVASSIATGVAAYKGGSAIFTAILAWTGVGAGAAMAINCSMNGFYTWRLGRGFADLFEKPGFELMDAARMAETLVAMLLKMPTKNEFNEFRRAFG